jgi:hypothetical protein
VPRTLHGVIRICTYASPRRVTSEMTLVTDEAVSTEGS